MCHLSLSAGASLDTLQIPSFESLQDAVYMSFERAETTLGDVLKKSQDPYGVGESSCHPSPAVVVPLTHAVRIAVCVSGMKTRD